MNTIITENGISYVLSSDGMYYPALKYDTTEPHYGKYALFRKRFLQEYHKGYYTALLLRGKLTSEPNRRFCQCSYGFSCFPDAKATAY